MYRVSSRDDVYHFTVSYFSAQLRQLRVVVACFVACHIKSPLQRFEKSMKNGHQLFTFIDEILWRWKMHRFYSNRSQFHFSLSLFSWGVLLYASSSCMLYWKRAKFSVDAVSRTNNIYNTRLVTTKHSPTIPANHHICHGQPYPMRPSLCLFSIERLDGGRR